MKVDPKWVRPIVYGVVAMALIIAQMWIELVALALLSCIPYMWGSIKPMAIKERPRELRDSFSDAYDISMMFLAVSIFGFTAWPGR